jgi:hypothetical protein
MQQRSYSVSAIAQTVSNFEFGITAQPTNELVKVAREDQKS